MSAKKQGKKPVGAVMVVGAGIAGVQAALDLANSGFYVHLVENKPAIGGVMAQLDKTFPTNDCSMCILSPKLVECGRHLNIEIHTLAEVKGIQGKPGNYTVTVEKQPRYIDPAKCTSCGDCAKVCPVTMPDQFNLGLADWKAIYRLYPQAIPSAFAIKKLDKAPCALTCPAGIQAQGYIQLIKQGKYAEAVGLIMDRLPLPGVLGRICPHPCEEKCRRMEVDQPVAICSLKRFAADQINLEEIPLPLQEPRGEQIAIIGSGPAGLTCAFHLALAGYRPTIFEALPVAGGMLRVGIPDYRLPKKILDQEINNILRLGVELKTNTALGRDFTLDDLFSQGYKAVFLAVGCHVGSKLDIPGEEADGVLQGVDLLRCKALGEPLKVGKKLAIIGGGNVAIDVACTARRLGSEVTIVYRRSREEMPAHDWEIEQATCEGVQIEYLAAPLEVVLKDGKVKGLRCQRMELGEPDASGRRRPVPIPGSEFELSVDMVVPAIGQKANLDFLAGTGIKATKWGTIEVHETTYQTSRPGVFAAGDVHTGPWIAIEAVGGGIEAAESIDRYIRGVDLAADRKKGEEAHERWRAIPKDEESRPREEMATLPPEICCRCFDEIAKGFTEAQAQAEASRCLNCGICSECMQCVTVCQAGAVDHSQKPQTVGLKVGAVILAPGFKPFDPSQYEAYHYASYPNVITSMEFERILSASGPFEGHLVRPSDHQEPKKIAWLQCVGSRDLHHCDNSYCSAVCCMYAIKEAVIAKEHSKVPLDCAIFFMDMRTMGKDFEKYYWRAEDEQGVRFVRSRVHSVDPVPGTDDVSIRYLDEDGTVKNETFDMLVLSVGMETAPQVLELAKNLGVQVNTSKFADTSPFTPVSTNRPGIYACGAFQGPKDIPQSVMEASAAASAASELLAPARYSLARKKPEFPERDISQEEPRIGVFVCHCGINIGGVVDVPAVREYAATLPYVEYVDENLFTCSQDTQVTMKQRIEEHRLNRIVVASCTPRTHEPLFQETIKEAGLNKYLFEMANIRDQDSWVHMHEPVAATRKAKDLVRMAVAKVALQQPLMEFTLPITKTGLIIGGGVAGLEAGLGLAEQGFQVHLVEKKDFLGGHALKLNHAWTGEEIQPYVSDLVKRVENHPRMEVHLNSEVTAVQGFVGNFSSTISTQGRDSLVEHGTAIIATGGHSFKPQEYLYKENPRVLLALEMDQAMREKNPLVTGAKSAVFIQCVGSREPERPYCSRVCCTHSVENALRLKEMNPEMDVFILYRDLRTYGLRENLYKEAREKGVLFIRFDLENKPRVEQTKDGKLTVTVRDHILGLPISIHPDVLTLASAIIVKEQEKLAKMFKVPLNNEGFYLEAHMKLRPVDFATEGVFVAGLAHYPKPMDEAIAQAKAAAARAAVILSQESIHAGGVVATIDAALCSGCQACVGVCPFGAIDYKEQEDVCEVNQALCKGCGTCAATCPSECITLLGFSHKQIYTMVDQALAEALP
jgi:heterodisulfide reductase subunit A-like polyferredoxin